MKRFNLKPLTLVLMTTSLAWGINCYAEPSPSTHQKLENFEHQAQQTFQDGWREGKLETSILVSDELSLFDIDAEVRGDKAYLSGIVKDPVEKQLAEEIALGVDGIEKVENAIIVDEGKVAEKGSSSGSSVKSAISDAMITAQVKVKLLSTENVPALDINVDTESKVVNLTGQVPSEAVKELVEKIAENTEGVKSVENDITVANS